MLCKHSCNSHPASIHVVPVSDSVVASYCSSFQSGNVTLLECGSMQFNTLVLILQYNNELSLWVLCIVKIWVHLLPLTFGGSGGLCGADFCGSGGLYCFLLPSPSSRAGS